MVSWLLWSASSCTLYRSAILEKFARNYSSPMFSEQQLKSRKTLEPNFVASLDVPSTCVARLYVTGAYDGLIVCDYHLLVMPPEQLFVVDPLQGGQSEERI